MSNNSSSTASLGNIIQPRSNNLGLNLPSRQSITVPPNLRSEIIIIPATSAPNWGSYFIFDIKERNTIISDIVLNFNVVVEVAMLPIIHILALLHSGQVKLS